MSDTKSQSQDSNMNHCYSTFQIKDDLSEPPLLLLFLIVSVVAQKGVLVEVQGLQIEVTSCG